MDIPIQAVPAYLKELAIHSRKRSSSFFSISSTTSSIFDFYHRLTPKAHPSITTTSALRSSSASGSFVPSSTAAAKALQLFLVSDPYEEHEDLLNGQNFRSSRGRGRYSQHTSSPTSHLHNQTKGSMPPFITRSLSTSSSRTTSPSPSPHRSTRSSLSHSSSRTHGSSLDAGTRPAVSTDLHPVLARLERDSKFCKTTVKCSACGKSGVNYPRCGRCGDMWCSRECRVGQAKKHACRRAV